jgi:transcriptional regulator with XRE-family HTH domain
MKNKSPINRLARMAGVSASHLTNIIEGRRRPSWSVGKRLADVAETSIALWMDGTPEEIKSQLSKHNNKRKEQKT